MPPWGTAGVIFFIIGTAVVTIGPFFVLSGVNPKGVKWVIMIPVGSVVGVVTLVSALAGAEPVTGYLVLVSGGIVVYWMQKTGHSIPAIDSEWESLADHGAFEVVETGPHREKDNDSGTKLRTYETVVGDRTVTVRKGDSDGRRRSRGANHRTIVETDLSEAGPRAARMSGPLDAPDWLPDSVRGRIGETLFRGTEVRGVEEVRVDGFDGVVEFTFDRSVTDPETLTAAAEMVAGIADETEDVLEPLEVRPRPSGDSGQTGFDTGGAAGQMD